MSRPTRKSRGPGGSTPARPSATTGTSVIEEIARILATGYLRLCEEARQGAKSNPSQQRSDAFDGQESASMRPGERP